MWSKWCRHFSDEPQRRITLLPEHLTDTNRVHIFEIFEGTNLMKELSHEEANQILVRSAPKEVCALNFLFLNYDRNYIIDSIFSGTKSSKTSS